MRSISHAYPCQGYRRFSRRSERYFAHQISREGSYLYYLLSSAVLLDRIKTVERDTEKLSSGNATLQMYIDNLTLQMAKRR